MTGAQQTDYEARGYLLAGAAFGPDELHRAQAAFDRAAGDGGLEDLPNRDDLFIHLAEHPALFPAVHRIIGDDVQVRSLRGVKVGPQGAGRGWHREASAGGVRAVSARGGGGVIEATQNAER